MAPTTRTHPVVDLDIYDDHAHRRDLDYSCHPTDAPSSILGEVHLGNIQNITKPTIDALATQFGNFHIDSSTKENQYEQHSQQSTLTRGHKPRPRVEFKPFQLPLVPDNPECEPPAAADDDRASLSLVPDDWECEPPPPIIPSSEASVVSHTEEANDDDTSLPTLEPDDWQCEAPPSGDRAPEASVVSHTEETNDDRASLSLVPDDWECEPPPPIIPSPEASVVPDDWECEPPSSGVRAPEASIISHTEEESVLEGALETAVRELPSNTEQLLKHHAGQFEWVLTVPARTNDGYDSARSGRPLGNPLHGGQVSPHADEKRVLFGCNLVRRKTPPGEAVGNKRTEAANVYTILATRIEGDENCRSSGAATIATADERDITAISSRPHSVVTRMDTPQAEAAAVRRTSGSALSSRKDDIADQILALPPAKPSSRIEDSVEALDKLEEELEALHEVARLDRVLSPEESKGGAVVHNIDTSLKRTGSVAKKAATGTLRVRTSAERSSSVRKSVSSAVSQDDDKPATATRGARKSLVSRPASLLPPKPPVRSSKPPTVSTFELPGEAVARRLKEQREARLSRQIQPEQAAAVAAAYSPSKPHAKSTKPPTRPTFELPGEAISRRKREEREARLRAQEEEERKRREFKARPIRTSIAPNSIPRETIASRARQGKLSEAEGTTTVTSTPNTMARKRQSMAAGTSAANPRASISNTRGRSELTVDSAAGTSRATSTSTGSIRGSGAGNGSVTSVSKRSTISTEDQAQQKARGRQIFSRDNGIAAERERERREREAAAKLARQEAAERSRQLSREWALKQKAKRASMRASE
ncbi:hypothetical protein QBC34DRAFT_420293 [Podospora aff. communis PSN243]|uniref:Carboxylesterase family protein n=1 Tax=Podospora aff. communis PSN243 TaxID=3040156 RepID=A0AAV9H515_9PEZI|nr:hypothetical protein QBC34DRAFT_420293 [Podospora aff. communis PSN243]